MKILIIRFSSIGDIVWTSPVVRCCKKQLPKGSEIHFATKSKFKELVENNPYIDKVIYLNESLNELLENLKKENYDIVLDLHNNLRSTIIKLYLRKKFFTFNKLSVKRLLFTKFQLDVMPHDNHVVDRMLKTVKSLGIVNDNKGLDFFIATVDEIKIENFPIAFKDGYAAFVIGASQPTKKLPLNKMAELCLKIGQPIILIGGKEDTDAGNLLIKYLEERGYEIKIFNACGRYAIAQSASIVRQAKVVYGHDTGLTHIAAAFGKKIFSIWGSTSSLGYTPYMGNNVVIENKNLYCHPCSKSGRRQCPEGHFKCMNELTFEGV